MNSKWYLSTLIFILALFGVSQKQNYAPNQEIVVQFADDEVTEAAAQNALEIVKKQLQLAGVDNIQVRELANGALKITYFSSIDVAGIQKIFSEENELDFDYTAFSKENNTNNFPSEENNKDYQLDILEIQNGYETASDFDGYLFELIPEKNRSSNPDIYISATLVQIQDAHGVEQSSYQYYKSIALAIQNHKGLIPEVRAGPLSS